VAISDNIRKKEVKLRMMTADIMINADAIRRFINIVLVVNYRISMG